MIWLTWRQHRTQLLAGAVALALIAAALLLTGFGIAATFRDSGLADCLAAPGRDCEAVQNLFDNRYVNLQFTIPLFLVLPALLGIFWGAPLVARELEHGTHRLAWTQGVSRLRWAGTKVVTLAGAAVLGAALLAWLLSWWSRPFVASSDNRFSFGVFDLRGIVPVAYALFALAVGVAAGTLIRRTVPAMAATVGVYAAVRLVVELWVRPHLASARWSRPRAGRRPVAEPQRARTEVSGPGPTRRRAAGQVRGPAVHRADRAARPGDLPAWEPVLAVPGDRDSDLRLAGPDAARVQRLVGAAAGLRTVSSGRGRR